MNYSKFKNIKLEDTNLMKKSTMDSVYNRLSKNNITNLKELFEKDDANNIDYGTCYYSNIHGYLRTKAIVKILRYKYLNENLPFLDYLNATQKDIDDPSEFLEILFKLGLNFNFAISIRNNSANDLKIINILENAYDKKIRICCSEPEYNKNILVIKIILEWYYKNVLKLEKINTLKEIKKIVESFNNNNNNNDRKQQYLYAKILLENNILNKKEKLEKKLSKLNNNLQ